MNNDDYETLIQLGDARRHGRAALVAAIRAFTVDMPNDQPNGEAERQLGILSDALHGQNLRKAIEAFVRYCDAEADQIKALRIAAEAYFSEDFRNPDSQPGRTRRPEKADSLFYLIDSRSVVGNCSLFWRTNSQGYTCDLGDAQKYAETARDIERDSDGKHIAVPCDLVDAAAIRHVRQERIDEIREATRPRNDAAYSRKPEGS